MADKKLNDLLLEDTAVVLYGENPDGSQTRIGTDVLLERAMDNVAKEDTQQEIKKALDLVKAEISVEDKLNIRAAIELKGG